MAFAKLRLIIIFLLGFHVLGGNWVLAIRNDDGVNFDLNYNVTWGYDHVSLFNDGKELQLSMDKSSGYFRLHVFSLSLSLTPLSLYILFSFFLRIFK